jgi:hypothetical protein
VAQPKSLAIVNQYLYRRGPVVAKHEYPSAKGVLLKHVFAEPGQTVDPFPEIRRLDRDQDAHLRRELDHASTPSACAASAELQKFRLRAARSGTEAPLR